MMELGHSNNTSQDEFLNTVKLERILVRPKKRGNTSDSYVSYVRAKMKLATSSEVSGQDTTH